MAEKFKKENIEWEKKHQALVLKHEELSILHTTHTKSSGEEEKKHTQVYKIYFIFRLGFRDMAISLYWWCFALLLNVEWCIRKLALMFCYHIISYRIESNH